jgi:hypothetical protein
MFQLGFIGWHIPNEIKGQHVIQLFFRTAASIFGVEVDHHKLYALYAQVAAPFC